jgi:two-component system OmpR family sensor kinase
LKLRARLLSAATLFFLVLTLLALLLVHSVKTSEIRQIDQQLTSFLPTTKPVETAIKQTRNVSAPPGFNSSHFSALYLATITKGTRKVVSTPLDAKHSSPQIPSTPSTSLDNISITTVGSTSGSLTWRAVLVAVPRQHAEILVAAPLNQVDETMTFLRLALLLTGLVMLVVLGATGYWITRLGLRPIAEVTEVAEAIVEGDRTRRVARRQQGTEAGKLARAFNVMLDEQQALEARLRQFVADASHELRTPVSVILGITELWRRGELRSGNQRDEAIHRIGVSGNQMGRVVEDLLLLARLDEGRPLALTQVDVGNVVRDVVTDVSTTNPVRSILLDLPRSPLLVLGDETGIRQVAVNLVNNALRHTPNSAVIEIHVVEEEDAALLSVKDSGPGMTPEEASHAFDRFWQADPSRFRTGAGLGLAIVRGIVDAHFGEVSLVSDPSSGTRVTVTIPRRES